MKPDVYKVFPKYILRTPLLPLNFFTKLTSHSEIIPDEKILEIFNDPTIKEAIFLASPSLYTQLEKFAKNELSSFEKSEKLKTSMLKYISRMCSRCTPYGLFAGCSVGRFSKNTDILLRNISEHERHTRLDMNYVISFATQLSKDELIRSKLKYYPNSSIYIIKNKVRYVEYFYKQNIRYHEIVAVDLSEYLEKIINFSKRGCYIEQIAACIVDEEIDINEATEFINELIECQILVSELEPSVSGPEFLDQIKSILEQRNIVDNKYVNFLNEINVEINNIDSLIGNEVEKYTKISEVIEKQNIDFDLKYLYQCDLKTSSISNFIDEKITRDIYKLILFLNSIKKVAHKSNLDIFKEAFYERYEGHEMPISKVLDPELGIGYGNNVQSNDDNPLLDDLFFPQNISSNESKEIKWSTFDDIIHNKIIKSVKEKTTKITIEDKDFSLLPDTTLKNLPETISFLLEIIKDDNYYKIKFNGGGGGSGSNLISRFCHGDEEINDFVKEISEFENFKNKDKIFAEIVHLPEARVGNILSRPEIRKYEIPYLARSIKPIEEQININDIMVSIKNNNIFLRSKTFDKEIIPRLTNAHNYSNNNSLPLYHFLCDMQTNNSSSSIYVDLNNFNSIYKFIPRIEYKNIILSYATWNLAAEDFKSIIKTENSNLLKQAIEIFKIKYSLPKYFLLADGDNELLININNLSCVKIFVDVIKKRSFIKLSEFIFNNSNDIIKDELGNNYTNEIIMTFHKTS